MSVIDLSALPPPDVVEPLDFEASYQRLLSTFMGLCPEWSATMESDPVVKLIELLAYVDVQQRAHVNDSARSTMLGFAVGADLEHLAAGLDTKRLVAVPGDPEAFPPVAPVMESEASLRTRAQGAFERLSVAGPRAAYELHARAADGRVADARAISPAPAEVIVSVLSNEGDGTASDELVERVRQALSDEDVRPLGDRLTVQAARIIPYRLRIVLYHYPGPEAEPMVAAAWERLQAYAQEQRRIGRDVRRSAIFAAAHVAGVQRVEVAEPAEDIIVDLTEASYCTGIDVVVGGADE